MADIQLDPPSIFLLGATGFVGSHLVRLLAQSLPQHRIFALVRSLTPARRNTLASLHPNLVPIEGILDDAVLVSEWAGKCPITINTANSDDFPLVKALLAGLETYSKAHPGAPPLYIHLTGLGLISDNCRGEQLDESQVHIWSDLDFHPNRVDPTNSHFREDSAVVDAGMREDLPIRTIAVYPSWIYGVGEGPAKSTVGVRMFYDMFKKAGQAGTWGPGANRLPSTHVKDVASAVFTVLKAALEGRAEEGKEGIYFATSDNPMTSMHEYTSAMGKWMHVKGLLASPESTPLPASVTEPFGELGWSRVGGSEWAKSERLYRLGWEPVESRKLTILESLPAELEVVYSAEGEGAQVSGVRGMVWSETAKK
ncbi:hypothetical protein BD626DRAFT_167911 [Schizophyllum amplum]|uniref:Uncharacterized protein n=1 Tax=Schizophyllum amplum TaxID=97359 RepID=A0A550CQE3_9AGAR|nr:hypothetical protein BD626DRAFT_167911 [Auriculariopsis ampla]